MVVTGLDKIDRKFPSELRGKRIGVLSHAPSITADFKHISDLLYNNSDCKLAALYGPQHGIFGETQDNMVEWNSYTHPIYRLPVFSLYGENRKPTPEMLSFIDVLIVDLQDVGARLYTYIWTVKLCMEACAELGIPIWILDRPNPIAGLDFDGPVLKEEFFTFVGGAAIPLCHRMTIGEMALWIKEKHVPSANLHVVPMDNWSRDMFYDETALPWVIPSPNMPTLQTAIVYPGMVLVEALNISEGRGTTTPFELFGAPSLKARKVIEILNERKLSGCVFREHNFIPTFHKYSGMACCGIQIHVTNRLQYSPVCTALNIFDAIIKSSADSVLQFREPPYEYEEELMPFDILSGDSEMRKVLLEQGDIDREIVRWRDEISDFKKEFDKMKIYK